MGKTADGRYQTYELKEYPGPFNKMLAAVFHWWWEQAEGSQPLELTPEELQVIRRFHSIIGPDFFARN